MKKKHTITFLFLAIGLIATAQSPVNNEGVRRQLESMVMTVWSKKHFRPKLYYQLIHNKYRKGEDRRYILQLAPTLATSKLNKDETTDENNEVNKDYSDEFSIDLDKRKNFKYSLLYEDHLDELFLRLYSFDIRSSLKVLEDYSDNPFSISEHQLIIQNFEERKTLIEDSYQESYKKNFAYDELIADIENYLGLLFKIRRELAVYNKYAPYLENQIKN
jgi:hypothetical protein